MEAKTRMSRNVKFVVAVLLSSAAVALLSTSMASVVMRFQVTDVVEFMLVNLAYGTLIGGIVGLLLCSTVAEEHDAERRLNRRPKRGARK